MSLFLRLQQGLQGSYRSPTHQCLKPLGAKHEVLPLGLGVGLALPGSKWGVVVSGRHLSLATSGPCHASPQQWQWW